MVLFTSGVSGVLLYRYLSPYITVRMYSSVGGMNLTIPFVIDRVVIPSTLMVSWLAFGYMLFPAISLIAKLTGS